MAILTKEVEIHIQYNYEYYKEKGYNIPIHYDNRKRKYCVESNYIGHVKVKDLPRQCNKEIDAKCDVCGKIKHISYNKYMNNIENNNGIYKCCSDKAHLYYGQDVSIENLTKQIKCFYNENNRFPLADEFITDNGFTFSISQAQNTCKEKQTTLKEIYSSIDDVFDRRNNFENYKNQINRLKQFLERYPNMKKHLYSSSFSQEYKDENLPSYAWFIKNCPDSLITTEEDLQVYLGVLPTILTKEQCITQIKEMSKTYNRPLKYDDFRGAEYGKPTLQLIRKYWGTVNKMKEDLGLEIIQQSMIDKTTNLIEVQDEILRICNEIKEKENRKIITCADFIKYNSKMCVASMQKYVTQDLHITLGSYIKSIGFELVKSGTGLKHEYEDGEITTSSYEYMFSNQLRNSGFIYGDTYKRDIRYKAICDYCGNINCDYQIFYKDRIIYVEIAGILRNYKNYYLNNKPITSSKHREEYRRKLIKKEGLLKDNNLEYYILFPCDLHENTLNDILNRKEVA